tara:strand:- start:85 stop:543 length:459 start_codon:yes stop_codon:yes gene_type:complete
MYVKITSGDVDTYPYSVGQLRRDNPNTSFPKQIPDDMLASHGVMPVTFVEAPSIDGRTQNVAQDAAPLLVGGAWTVGWTTVSNTSEQTQAWDDGVAASNRSKRDGLLAATDYFALSDVTMNSDMASYRQLLRDITSHANFPNLEDADWPVKP